MQRYLEVKRKLVDIEKMAEERPLLESELFERMNINKELLEFEDAKLRDAQKKARIKRIKDGDGNSKFFHSSIKQNIKSSRVHGLSINGEWISEPVRVKTCFIIILRIVLMKPLLIDRHFSVMVSSECLWS